MRRTEKTNLSIQPPNNIIMPTNPLPSHKMHTPNPHPHFLCQLHPIRPRRLIRIRIIHRHRVARFERCASRLEALVARFEEVLVYTGVVGGKVGGVEC